MLHGKGHKRFMAKADAGPGGMVPGASAESPRKAFLKKVKRKRNGMKTNAKAKSA